MQGFIPGNQPLLFPAGTVMEHNSVTWAMYINKGLNCTWIGYAVPGGTKVIMLPGIRTRVSPGFDTISSYVAQKQAAACGECGG